jgi:hypothetical protein
MVGTPGVLDRAATVKGWDFSQFYALGQLGLAQHRGDLASGAALRHVAIESISPTFASSTFVPVYGPQIALLFSPLAKLPYVEALACWLAFSAAIYAGCCFALWRHCPSLRPYTSIVAVLAIGSPILFLLVCYGQLSAIALGLFTLAFLALQRERPFIAGLAIGSLIYKPQLGLAPAIIFVAAGEWLIVAGAAAAVIAQLTIAWLYAGPATLGAYVRTLVHLNDQIALVQEKRYLLQSLPSFFNLILPWPHVALVTQLSVSTALLAATWRVWRSDAALPVRYSMLLLTTVLVSPHFYVYDLIILVPVAFMLTDWLLHARDTAHQSAVAICLALLYVIPLAGAAIAKTTAVQPTTLILCVLAGAIAHPWIVKP